jgi:hypothetical protein
VGRLVADGRAVGEAIVGARKLSIAGGALFLWLATTAIVVVFVVILRQMFCLLLYLACAGFSVALIASTTIRITIAGTAAGTHLWLADLFFVSARRLPKEIEWPGFCVFALSKQDRSRDLPPIYRN